MAFGLTTQGPASILARPPINTAFPGNSVQWADQTFTTAKVATSATALAVSGTRFRVVVYLKSLTLGANTGATNGPLFYLQVADNSGMSTNLFVLGGVQQAANVASSTATQVIEWDCPVGVAARAYVSVVCDPTPMGTGSAGTFDAYVEAVN